MAKTRLDTLLHVVRIPERTLASHLHWATWGFQDIVFKRLGGANPFGNAGARYFGSPDDDDLNRRVLRYAADAKAVERFAADADLTGKIKAPVLTVHAIDDPTAFVELETVFRETMAGAGQSGNLVQTYTDEHDHSYLQDAEYVALTTRAYRKAVDDAWAGRERSVDPVVDKQVEAQLEQVYSRGLGSFFLTGTNHQAVVNGRAPRHRSGHAARRGVRPRRE
jgi:surface antigen